jgi:hypothetical protein
MNIPLDKIIEKRRLKLKRTEKWIRVYSPIITLCAFIVLLYAADYTEKTSDKILGKPREPLEITKLTLKSHPEIVENKNKFIEMCNSDIEAYVLQSRLKQMLSTLATLFAIMAFIKIIIYFKHREDWKKEKEELILLEGIHEAITNDKKI